MDNAQVRAAISAALSEVDGLTGYERRPMSPRPGDAWPLWRGSERSGGYVFVQTFAVVVALPAGEVDADSFADSHGVEIADALESVLFVDTMAPAVVAAEGGDMLALMITGRTE